MFSTTLISSNGHSAEAATMFYCLLERLLLASKIEFYWDNSCPIPDFGSASVEGVCFLTDDCRRLNLLDRGFLHDDISKASLESESSLSLC